MNRLRTLQTLELVYNTLALYLRGKYFWCSTMQNDVVVLYAAIS